MIRKGKKYLRPKKPFESARIKEENVLAKKYGLKNKKEIWKTLAKINYYRGRAKALAKSSKEEQEVLFAKLQKIGLNVKTIADVLDLKVENLLERRLQTVVVKNKLATTAKQARQMIVHKSILIDDKVVNIPSYIVSISEEKNITKKQKNKKTEQLSNKAETISISNEANKEKEDTIQ